MIIMINLAQIIMFISQLIMIIMINLAQIIMFISQASGVTFKTSTQTTGTSRDKCDKDGLSFPVPYDLPLTAYSTDGKLT